MEIQQLAAKEKNESIFVILAVSGKDVHFFESGKFLVDSNTNGGVIFFAYSLLIFQIEHTFAKSILYLP